MTKNELPRSQRHLNFHDTIVTSIGKSGRYQLVILLACMLVKMFSAWALTLVDFPSTDTWFPVWVQFKSFSVLSEKTDLDWNYGDEFKISFDFKRQTNLTDKNILSINEVNLTEFPSDGLSVLYQVNGSKPNPFTISTDVDRLYSIEISQEKVGDSFHLFIKINNSINHTATNIRPSGHSRLVIEGKSINGSTAYSNFIVYNKGENANLPINSTYEEKCNEIGNNETTYNLDFDKGNYTMVGEFKLVCANKWIINFIATMQLLGGLIGAVFIGQLGDLYGRKDGIVFTYICLVLFSFIEGLSVNYYVVILCKTMIGFAATGLMVISQMYLIEFVGIKCRTKFLAIPGWQIGLIILGIVSQIFPHWKHLCIAMSLIGSPIFIAFCFCPESLRWLLLQGRLHDAKKILTKAATKNKVKFDPTEFDRKIPKEIVEAKKYQLRYTTWTIIKHKLSRGLVLPLAFIWFTMSFGYTAHSFNTTRIKDDGANLILMAVLEIVVIIILYAVTLRFGRHYTIAISFLVVAITSISISISYAVAGGKTEATQWVHDIFGWFSRALLSSLYFCLVLLTAENFPTVVRTSALGLFYVFFRCGGLAGLQHSNLYKKSEHIPYTMTASFAVISALCCLRYKNTLNIKLPDYYLED